MNQEQVIETMTIQKMVGKVANAEGHPADQLKFFTADCQVRIYVGDEQILDFSGKKYLENGLKTFLGNLKRCHYMLGQHTIDFLAQDKAAGLLFCRASHVKEDYGEDIIVDYCIFYEDIYEKVRGEWLIKARDIHFLISNKQVLSN
ncbi:MAG: nuclear transport factor 2 family protein [Selenomonadaceae bacterium]|nr:nuclear transport factor 2 family protein [Selenomonadaceae bacterium]